MLPELKPQTLFTLEHSLAGPALADCEAVWMLLPRLADLIRSIGSGLPTADWVELAPEVWVARGVDVPATVTLHGPAIIGPGTELRPGAYVRGSVLVGRDCVVGNSTELKNCILFDQVQVPHFNYVGDSILGWRAHLGAGVICSNVRTDGRTVRIQGLGDTIDSQLKKLGAILGDGADVGSNSVLNPGTVLGPGSRVYPLSSVRRYVPSRSIHKQNGDIVAILEEAK
ncbi:MAG: UDP-N-acetylglucosamine pyrophosphorylase [Bacillota bacterium]|nr:UDP-N-acetylglucosamine pyrophosphorylase [Bacillota bacterium]